MKLSVETTPPYPVSVGEGVLEGLAERISQTRVALVSDENVAIHYGEKVGAGLREAGKRVTLYIVPPGEESKTLPVWGDLLQRMAGDGFDRASAVLSLGGGVVSDLAGFVAASFMRGVPFYACPTSLLAMVDASVGGKTGLNLPEGKNLVGAFWQPQAVFADVATLRSLPEREFRVGAVESFKHGLLADPELLNFVHDDTFRPDGSAENLAEHVYRSVSVKANVVAADVHERGRRAHLNLGHTLAHALEAHTHHRLSHGDAVAYGLLFAAELSALRGYSDETERVRDLLAWLEPPPLNGVSFENLKPFIARDKKGHSGVTRWVLLERVGAPVIVDDVTDEELRLAWQHLEAR